MSSTAETTTTIRKSITISDAASWYYCFYYCSSIALLTLVFISLTYSYDYDGDLYRYDHNNNAAAALPTNHHITGINTETTQRPVMKMMMIRGSELLQRPCQEIYVVGEGETLQTIGEKCGDQFIVERNPHINDPDDVYPGLVIKVKIKDSGIRRMLRYSSSSGV